MSVLLNTSIRELGLVHHDSPKYCLYVLIPKELLFDNCHIFPVRPVLPSVIPSITWSLRHSIIVAYTTHSCYCPFGRALVPIMVHRIARGLSAVLQQCCHHRGHLSGSGVDAASVVHWPCRRKVCASVSALLPHWRCRLTRDFGQLWAGKVSDRLAKYCWHASDLVVRCSGGVNCCWTSSRSYQWEVIDCICREESTKDVMTLS